MALKRYSWRFANGYIVAEVCADMADIEQRKLVISINAQCMDILAASPMNAQGTELQMRVTDVSPELLPRDRVR